MQMFSFFLISILKIFFRLLYNEFAWSYDFVADFVSAGLWLKWIYQIIPYTQGPDVLELGHGPGHLQARLHSMGFHRIVGLDASRQMGRIARRRFIHGQRDFPSTGNGYAQSLALVRGSGLSLPFPSASFHSVIATFPTEYIFDPKTLAEIYRVLIPGGNLSILFTARITGTRLRERASALLFRITGQSDEWHAQWFQSFRQAGLLTEARWLPLESSQVFLLHAHKPLNPEM